MVGGCSPAGSLEAGHASILGYIGFCIHSETIRHMRRARRLTRALVLYLRPFSPSSGVALRQNRARKFFVCVSAQADAGVVSQVQEVRSAGQIADIQVSRPGIDKGSRELLYSSICISW